MYGKFNPTKPAIALLNRAYPLASGLIGAWIFNEGLGTNVYDSSGNNHTGLFSFSSSVLWNPPNNPPGLFGPNLLFDGLSGNINCGKFPNPITFSISCWFNISNIYLNDFSTLVGAKDSAATANWCELDITYEGAQVYLYYQNGAATNYLATSSTTINENQWYHIVATVNPTGTGTLYLNAVSQQFGAGGSGGTTAPAENLHIGSAGDYTGGQFFPGFIDNVMIWNRVLSQTEARELYENPFAMYEPKRYYDHSDWLVNPPAATVPVDVLGSPSIASNAFFKTTRWV
jgi:hypothetical protein